MNVKKQFEKFLKACIDCDNFEANPILQDYMGPELTEYIECEILREPTHPELIRKRC